MDFGSTMRQAREARGLTTSQLAAQTRIIPQTIVGMEKNDFSSIPAPIYGRGFVKLICENLGLDPVPMVAAFMAAYNGKTDIDLPPPSQDGGIVHSEPPPPPRPAAEPPPAVPPAAAAPLPGQPAPETEAAIPPQPAADVTADPVAPPKSTLDASLEGLELFDPSVSAAAAEEDKAAAAPADADGFSRFASPQAAPQDLPRFAPPPQNDDFSRFATPMPDEDPQPSPIERFREGFSTVTYGVLGKMDKIKRPALRMTALAVAVLVVVGLCAWGIVALFRATSGAPEDAGIQQQVKAETAAQEAGPKEDRGNGGGEESRNQPEKGADQPAPAPARSTVPLKLPAFYVD